MIVVYSSQLFQLQYFSYNKYAWEWMVKLCGSCIKNPKVPETSVHVVYVDEDGAYLASSKSERCYNKEE